MAAPILATTLVCFLAIFTFQETIVAAQEGGLCSPTPRNFSQVFISECNRLVKDDNCTAIWGLFTSAFAGRDPSTVTAGDYGPYFNRLPGLSRNLDNSLFWSRTPELVEMLSCMCTTGANVVSSANIPSTAIINGDEEIIGIDELRWCGTTDPSSADGIEYVNNCPCSVSFAFFEEFSILFARAAEGLVFYLGYGENPGGTFNETSFFSQYELPNMNTSLVRSATILVVHRKGKGESCGNGTLIELRRRIEAKGFGYVCYDVFGDPRDSTQVPSLTACAMGIINSVQQGREPDGSSGCFMRESSAVSTVHLSLVLIAIAALIALTS